jgi:hypothetical protein
MRAFKLPRRFSGTSRPQTLLEHQGLAGPEHAEEAGEDEGDHVGHHRSGRPKVNVDKADGVNRRHSVRRGQRNARFRTRAGSSEAGAGHRPPTGSRATASPHTAKSAGRRGGVAYPARVDLSHHESPSGVLSPTESH